MEYLLWWLLLLVTRAPEVSLGSDGFYYSEYSLLF